MRYLPLLLSLLLCGALTYAQSNQERLEQALQGPDCDPATDATWTWENDRLIAHCREVRARIDELAAAMNPPPRMRTLPELPATRPADPTRMQLLGEHRRLRQTLNTLLEALGGLEQREIRRDRVIVDLNVRELLEFTVSGEATIESIERRALTSAQLIGQTDEHVVHRFVFRAFSPEGQHPTLYTLHTVSTPTDRRLVKTTIAGQGDPVIMDRRPR